MKIVMNEAPQAKREEALERALQQIEKAYGKGAIMQLDKMEADVKGISTGTLSLDLALGGKGLPRGRIVEDDERHMRLYRRVEIVTVQSFPPLQRACTRVVDVNTVARVIRREPRAFENQTIGMFIKRAYRL